MPIVERPRKLDFPLTKGMNCRGVIYIPSTTAKDKNIPKSEFNRRINKVARTISDTYGGNTTQRMAIGNWFDDRGKFVSEDIARIEFFTNRKDYLRNDSKLGRLIYALTKQWGQDALSFELKTGKKGNALHFIPKKRKDFLKMIYTTKGRKKLKKVM